MVRMRCSRLTATAFVVAAAGPVAACAQETSDVVYPSTTAPVLTRTVSFQGVSIHVPGYFRVYPSAATPQSRRPCHSTGNTAVVGPPLPASACYVGGRLTSTIVTLTTDEAYGPHDRAWKSPTVIGGLTVYETAGTSTRYCYAMPNSCIVVSELDARVPSAGVAVVVWAGGSVQNGALQLGQSIVRSITEVK